MKAERQLPGLSDSPAVTHDAFLGGRLTITQPAAGYRAGMDAVLLAATVSASPGSHILDAGAGVGTVGLAIAARVSEVAVTGIECDPEMAELAGLNSRNNGFHDRVRVVVGNIDAPPPTVPGNGYHQVVCNPPYFNAARQAPSQNPKRALARTQGDVDLAAWLRFCLSRLQPGGLLTLIYRADALAALLTEISHHGVQIFPLWPKAGMPAKLLILRIKKGSRQPLQMLHGLVLHDPAGGYRPEVEAILRDGAALRL